MPQIINTNIASLNAQRNLNASQGAANTAMERLSSGLRINSAKDDAAGLAISTRFDSQITGLNMAQRNANDGISLAQTAEGAMDEITNNLQRIRELSVQAANASNSISDRQALNQEVTQRVEEVNRIASQTSFNGLKVLDGTFGTQTFQVGANTGETIGISGLDSRGSQIGSVIKETDNFSDFTISKGNPGEVSLDLSALTLTDTGSTFNVSLGGTALTLSSTPPVTSAATLADAINEAVSDEITGGNTSLSGVSATTSANGDSLIIANAETSPISANISIDDGRGTQKSETVAGPNTLTRATLTSNQEVLFSQSDFSTLDGSTIINTSFNYNGSDGSSGTITAAIAASGSDPIDDLVSAINTELGSSPLDGSLRAVASTDGSSVEIVNDTDGTSYTFSTVRAADSVSPTPTTVPLSDVSLQEGTITKGSQALVSDISAFDLDSGVTGSLDVAGTKVNFSLGADNTGANDLAALAGKASQALSQSGFTNLSVEVNGAGTGLNILNGSRTTPFDISNLELADGGTDNTVSLATPIPRSETLSLTDSFAKGDAYDFNVKINGENYSFEKMTSLNDIVSQINSESNETGVQANLNASNDEIIFSSQFGESFDINIQADFDGNGTFDPATETVQKVNATVENDTKSMNDIDISSTEGADTALIAVDFAIDTINSFRATLGAVQNRFESTIANLATTTENLSASNSRIRDADFAAESAELARTQVLQQAGLSVLSQANARPQQVLQLLQG